MPAPDGFVPTPDPVATYTVTVAFGAVRPSERSGGGRVLLPGLGTGQLYAAIDRYCRGEPTWIGPSESYPQPECVGVEIDQSRIDTFHARYPETANIDVTQSDFLLDPPQGPFDWVVANPPYCRFKNIPTDKREAYQRRFDVCEGQYPLFAPFVEQAMRLLAPGGWATFILPLSALMTDVTEPLRDVFRGHFAGPIRLLPNESFEQQVQTVVISLQNDWDRSKGGGHLWLEPMHGVPLEAMLDRLGVGQIEAALEGYTDSFESARQTVANTDRRERSSRSEYQYAPGGQSCLDRFCG